MNLGELMTAVRTRALLELDQLTWRRQTAPLARRRDHPLARRRVLICDLFPMIATVKSEAILSAALRADGFAPVVLLEKPSPLIEQYYRAAGPTDFVYLNDARDDDTCRAARSEADRLVDEDPDLSQVFEFQPDGYRIGRNVMSSVVRRFRVGRIDAADDAQRQAVREVLAEALATKTAIERILDRERIDLALFNERGYTPAAEVFDACLVRGIDCVQWLGAPQSDCLVFKRYDLAVRDRHPLALSDATWETVKRRQDLDAEQRRVIEYLRSNYESGAWFNRQQLQVGKKVKPPEEVRAQLGLDPAKKTAVIFSHILYDATFFYGESLFPDYETWLIEAVRAAAANPALNWIVKVHPVNVWRSRMDNKPIEQLEVRAIREAIGPLPEHVKILPADTDINTFALFSVTDYGLTVRGTIGMELPCFGVPVVTAGTGRYSGRGFTIDPKSQEAFRETLARLHKVPPLGGEAVRLAQLYTYGSFFLRPVPMTGFVLDFNANTFGLPALGANVRVDPAHADRLETAPDLARFCAWVSARADDDLLSRDIGVLGATNLPSETREADPAAVAAGRRGGPQE